MTKPTPVRSAKHITVRSINGNRHWDCDCGWSETVNSWSTVEAVEIAARHARDHTMAHESRDGYWDKRHGFLTFDSPVAS